MWRKIPAQTIFIVFLLMSQFLAAIHPRVLTATTPSAVYLNGAALQFDISPNLQHGVPMFPLRKIFEEMGYDVSWEAEAKRAVLQGPGRVVVLYPQNPLYSVNGAVYRTSSPPFIERGRLMVGMDFLQQGAGIEEVVWDEEQGILYLEYRSSETDNHEAPLPLEEGTPVNFVEVLLPAGNGVQAGDSFDIVIAAPFVKDIYSYEIVFFYNPEIMEIKDLKNPSYKAGDEFYIKRINNSEGMIEYIQTSLGYREEIPPRSHLVVMEAVALREGAVPFLESTLQLKLLDNAANHIPVALEEKTLYTATTR
jgi:hypothetical protein